MLFDAFLVIKRRRKRFPTRFETVLQQILFRIALDNFLFLLLLGAQRENASKFVELRSTRGHDKQSSVEIGGVLGVGEKRTGVALFRGGSLTCSTVSYSPQQRSAITITATGVFTFITTGIQGKREQEIDVFQDQHIRIQVHKAIVLILHGPHGKLGEAFTVKTGFILVCADGGGWMVPLHWFHDHISF